MCMHIRALHTSHTAHCSIACWRTRVCMHPAARSPCVRHIRATPHTREIPNPNPSIRAGRARAGRLQNPSRAGRPCRTSEPSRAGRRPFRSEPSRAEHRQPKIRAVARLGSVRSLAQRVQMMGMKASIPKPQKIHFSPPHSRETSVFRDEDLVCYYGRLPWRVMAQVPNLCWERPLDTTLRLVLLVGMIPHCRKRNGVKACADSVTSIDTAQRQRRRSLFGTIMRRDS